MIKAVIVGINRYPSAPLQGCVNDALDVISHLETALGAESSNIVPLYDGRATKRAIVAALRNMIAAASPGDHLLFHYSGHGTRVAAVDPDEFDGLDETLCPVDFDWGDPSTALTDGEIGAILATVPVGSALTVVLDSCHSGDMLRDGNDDARRGEVDVPRFLPPPPDVAYHLAKREPRLRRRPLAMLNASVVSACRDDETAMDTSFNGRANGAFTYQWLRALRAHPTHSLAGLVEVVTPSLARFEMHPQLEGSDLLKTGTFLAAPVSTDAAEVSRLLGTAEVVFEERWSAKVLGVEVNVGLQVSIANGYFEFRLSRLSGVPLTWTFVINGNTREQVDIALGFAIVLGIDSWTLSAGAVRFDLTISVKPPFFGPVLLTRQQVALPRVPVGRPLPAPTSAGDLLALLQFAGGAHPIDGGETSAPALPRDDDNQYTGGAGQVTLSGFYPFGLRFNANHEIDAYVPFGFVRQNIEVVLDPPGWGSVQFVKWLDSDPHLAGFEYHVGAPGPGGGVARFRLHCVRDWRVNRQLPSPVRPGIEPAKDPVHQPLLTNGDGGRAASASEVAFQDAPAS